MNACISSTVCTYDLFMLLILQVAKDLGPGNVIVTALCDTGQVWKLFSLVTAMS